MRGSYQHVRFALFWRAGYRRSSHVEWGEWGERTTPTDDDALRHAKSRICGHLLVTQMTHREAERAAFCSTDL